MKNSFTLTASLLMGLGTLSAQTSNISGISDLGSGTHQFTVSGQVSDVSLCTYEICQRSAEGTLEVLPVVAGSASALLGKASVPDAAVRAECQAQQSQSASAHRPHHSIATQRRRLHQCSHGTQESHSSLRARVVPVDREGTVRPPYCSRN